MNLVDMLKDRLVGEVGKKLGGSGLGKLLVPGAVIAALIGAAIFFMNNGG